jgi:hypothetical protein
MVFRFHKISPQELPDNGKRRLATKAFINLGHASCGVKRAANIEKQRRKSRFANHTRESQRRNDVQTKAIASFSPA